MVELQLLLEIIDRASSQLSGVRQELVSVDKGADSAESGLRRVDDALRDTGQGATSFGAQMKTAWAEVTTGINSAIGIAKQVAQVVGAAFDTLTEGAQLGQLNRQFETVATGIGSTGQTLLTALRQASQGAATDTELIGSSVQLLGMNVIQTEDHLERVVNGVSRLKDPTEDLSKSLDNFGLLLANRSIKRLDEFKISSQGVQERLAAMGAQSAQSATDGQFLEAVLAEMDASMKRLGTSTGSTVSGLDKLRASFGNSADVMKTGVSQAVLPLADALVNLAAGADAQATAQERSEAVTRNLLQSSPALMTIYSQLLRQTVSQAEAEALHRESLDATAQAWADEAEMAQAALRPLPELIYRPIDALRDHENEVRAAADAYRDLLTNLEPMYAAWEHTTVSLSLASDAYQAYNERVQATVDLMRGEFVTAIQGGEEATFDLAGNLFELADKLGLNVGQTAALTGALTDYSPEAINAALQSSYLAGALEEVVKAFAEGKLSAERAQLAWETFVARANALNFAPISAEIAALIGQIKALEGEHKIILTVEQRGNIPSAPDAGDQGPKGQESGGGSSGGGNNSGGGSSGGGGGDDQYGQYALGGWTGSRGGYVHPYELVVPQETLTAGPAALLAFADQHTPGGIGGQRQTATVAPEFGTAGGGVTFIFNIDASGSLMSADVWRDIAKAATAEALATAGLRAEPGSRGW